MDALSFVIAGHIDHGKSTLIGRLLYDTESLTAEKIEEIENASKGLGRETEFAYLLDHLEEERRQGITIDTAQFFFETQRRRYVIIDAPGHVEFVKNMITGASGADAAVIIVDAEQGVQEQTKRHSYMLSLLGIEQVIVVINKMDLVDFSRQRFGEVEKEMKEFLGSIGIRPIYYIPISAIQGDNVASRSERISWYSGPSFLKSLDILETGSAAMVKEMVLPIQDVYKIEDKRISVGRVEAGGISAGEKIKILPTGQMTNIKSIEKFSEEMNSAAAGECIGITTVDSVFLDRGYVVCPGDTEVIPTDSFDAMIFWMSKKPLRRYQRIVIRCATQETVCSVEAIEERIDSASLEVLDRDAEVLENLEVGRVRVRTANPIVIKAFSDVQELGRFVLVQDEDVCAGGIITCEG